MSLKTIAALVGVSPSTVSRVLTDASPTCASSELKDKIWKAARETGYVPNGSARSLRTGSARRAYAVSCIVTRANSVDEDPFFTELERRVHAELYACGCALGGVFDAYNASPEALDGSDGIVILGRCPEYLPRKMRSVTRNLVGISRNPRDFEMDEVVCDGKRAAELAVGHLFELGHKKIAYIGDCSDEDRHVGYCEALIRRQLPLDRELMLNVPQTRAGGRAATLSLMERGLCTAAFCANDITALGALEALRGRHPRERLSVVSIDNIEAAALSRPGLTTVNVPAREMAHIAALLLCDRMAGAHREPTRVELPCALIKRESAGELK